MAQLTFADVSDSKVHRGWDVDAAMVASMFRVLSLLSKRSLARALDAGELVDALRQFCDHAGLDKKRILWAKHIIHKRGASTVLGAVKESSLRQKMPRELQEATARETLSDPFVIDNNNKLCRAIRKAFFSSFTDDVQLKDGFVQYLRNCDDIISAAMEQLQADVHEGGSIVALGCSYLLEPMIKHLVDVWSVVRVNFISHHFWFDGQHFLLPRELRAVEMSYRSPAKKHNALLVSYTQAFNEEILSKFTVNDAEVVHLITTVADTHLLSVTFSNCEYVSVGEGISMQSHYDAVQQQIVECMVQHKPFLLILGTKSNHAAQFGSVLHEDPANGYKLEQLSKMLLQGIFPSMPHDHFQDQRDVAHAPDVLKSEDVSGNYYYFGRNYSSKETFVVSRDIKEQFVASDGLVEEMPQFAKREETKWKQFEDDNAYDPDWLSEIFDRLRGSPRPVRTPVYCTYIYLCDRISGHAPVVPTH